MKNEKNHYFLAAAIFCFLFFQWFPMLPLPFDRFERGPEVSDYVREVWQIDDGLPQNYIRVILQTRDGYIWVATQEGIARFDGVKFVTFNNENTPEIRINYVHALIEDREGSLWIGTDGGGLLRFKAGKFTSFRSKIGAPDDIVMSLCEDREGSIWIGTHGGGLIRFKEGKFTTYNTKKGLSNSTVLSIYEDRKGNLWIGTGGGGLNRLKDGKFKTFTKKHGLSNNHVWSILEDKSGSLWIGTYDGLNRFIDGKLVNYTVEKGLSSDAVFSICEDQEGNLWIGTGGGGLCQWKHSKFKTCTTKEGLPKGVVFPIFEDHSGTLWFGTIGGGLSQLKNNKFKTYTIKEGLSSDVVRSIYEDRRGNLWIGTHGGGLNRFNNNKFTVYTTENGLSSNHINTIYESRDGSLWIGTNGQGLDRFKNGSFTNYTTKNGLPNNFVYALLEDSKGNLWIGTAFGGLVQFREETFKTYNAAGILPDHCILTIYEDKEENLWLGTIGGGLIRFKAGKFTAYTTKQGLFNNLIFQLLEDEKENFWMSCNKGIFRVSKQELNQLDQGKRHSIRCISYGKTDGMKNSECTGGSQPAGWKTRDGRLWFPTVKGVVIIDPNNIKTNPIIPTVIIEKIKIDDAVIDTIQDIEISPGKRRFEFHYTAPSFVAPKKMKFKYKLEGFEKEWIDAGSPTDRTACYTNIPPGSYCFRVIACNNDGTWNKTGASFYFNLKPFFYQTYWFYGTCILCVLAMGIGIHWLRVRQIIIRERKKYEKARLTFETAEKYLKRLLHFMESKKPYLNPDISLHKLSEDIMIPHHYLSQVINARLNQNFYDFINHYRIEEAKKILSDSKNHLPILGVAFEVGFNSKSAFNRAFKKNVNMTPSDFKKERNDFLKDKSKGYSPGFQA
ncbi:MAG: helix-turn-helix domain-containing protein [Candidatus Aminicenantes bacterium]|nr:MAG: helix-turn-helix domain-containing protein [Candidatus Aminicenantes bacterium]